MNSTTDASGRPHISSDDLSAVVQIIALVCLVFAGLFIAAQFLTKYALRRRFNVSDGLMLFALILVAGETAMVLSAPGRAIGKAASLLTEKNITATLEILFACDILSILALGTTKLSILVALYEITPDALHRRAIFACGCVIGVWAICAIVITGFQCPAPHRWDVRSVACLNIIMLRTAISAVNIFTDAALMGIATLIVMPLQAPLVVRVAVLTAFWARAIVIAASAVYLAFLQQLVFNEEYLHHVWQAVMCNQIVLCTGIMMACVPFLKPFLLSLESGFLRADDENRRTAVAASAYASEGNGSKKYVKIGGTDSFQKSIELQSNVTSKAQS